MLTLWRGDIHLTIPMLFALAFIITFVNGGLTGLGSVTYYWFTPTRTGTFEVLCAELCGAAHAQMRSKVIVEEEKDYHAWLEKQRTFAELSGQHNIARAAYKTESE